MQGLLLDNFELLELLGILSQAKRIFKSSAGSFSKNSNPILGRVLPS